MNYVKCEKDHFYDADTYPSCPFCGGNVSVNETVNFPSPVGDDAKTTPLGGGKTVPIGGVPGITMPLGDDDSEGKTVFISPEGKKDASSLVVGWLVCLNGEHRGKDFRLEVGKNSIGRGADMDVALTNENTVSREKHAIIVYEPKENVFLALPGEAKELFYLNGKVVLDAQKLVKGDRLQIGSVELMFVPCCGEDFSWT